MMYLYQCNGCGCPRKVPALTAGGSRGPRPTLSLFCQCCHAAGMSYAPGMPHGSQVFHLAAIVEDDALPAPARPVPADEPDLSRSVDAPYTYTHPTDPLATRRLAFARYLFETGRISEGEGAPDATQN